MRAVTWLVSIHLLLGGAAAWGGERQYRVSGIVAQENRWLLAVIEEAPGSCRVYAKGDRLGGWPIAEILPNGVLLEAAGERRLLRLEESAVLPAPSGAPELLPPPAMSTRLVQGELSLQEAKAAVDQLAAELGQQRQVDPESLNALLGFSPRAVISAINESRVGSASEAVRLLQGALASGLPLDFILSEGQETAKVYFRFNQPAAAPGP